MLGMHADSIRQSAALDFSPRFWRYARRLRPAAIGVCVLGWLAAAGCSPGQPQAQHPTTAPGAAKPSATQPEAITSKPAEEAASKPAAEPKPAQSRPAASKPAGPLSKFSSEPPYPVDLHVWSPQDPQPGWLKILTLDNKGGAAVARGVFPEQNVMIVDTENVKRIQIHVGYLPMAAKKRVVLRIDNQGMELGHNQRYLTFERRPTGEWVMEKPKK